MMYMNTIGDITDDNTNDNMDINTDINTDDNMDDDNTWDTKNIHTILNFVGTFALSSLMLNILAVFVDYQFHLGKCSVFRTIGVWGDIYAMIYFISKEIAFANLMPYLPPLSKTDFFLRFNQNLNWRISVFAACLFKVVSILMIAAMPCDHILNTTIPSILITNGFATICQIYIIYHQVIFSWRLLAIVGWGTQHTHRTQHVHTT